MKTLFLDAGHGAIDPKTGKYTTAPSKMWTHSKGKFHQGSIFLEGVSNRAFCDEIFKEGISKGINIVKVYHDWQDNSLNSRSTLANTYHSTISEGIFLSMHSNAINKQDGASGFSIWTSPGTSASDALATAIWNGVSEDVSKKWDIRMMSQKSDGDVDYEAKFAVLVNTKMPAVLLENLFFDNYNDSVKLMNPEYRIDMAKSIIKSIISFL
jgi:N-acetylmuramoyl-L-alanine amidase